MGYIKAIYSAAQSALAKTTVSTISTAAAVTFTAAQLLGGLILRDPNGASRADLVPTAADLLAAIEGPEVGDSVEFTIRNEGEAAEIITVTTNTGATLVGQMTITGAQVKRFKAVITSVVPGAEAYSLYAISVLDTDTVGGG